jgi:hypothetical protein
MYSHPVSIYGAAWAQLAHKALVYHWENCLLVRGAGGKKSAGVARAPLTKRFCARGGILGGFLACPTFVFLEFIVHAAFLWEMVNILKQISSVGWSDGWGIVGVLDSLLATAPPPLSR